MKLNPYLNFDGNGWDAAQFYAEVFDAELAFAQKFSEMPNTGMAFTDEQQNRLAHARVIFGENVIMISDTLTSEDFHGHHGFSVQIQMDSLEKAQAVFDALSKNGQVTMPFGPQFWAQGFGMVKDQFGVHFMVNVD